MKVWCALALSLSLLAGCDGGGDDGGTDAGPNDSGVPCLEPTFTSIYTERLNQPAFCSGAGCHDAASKGGGQDYTAGQAAAHATMLAATENPTGANTFPMRVVPMEPDMSFLFIKLTRADAPGGRMPLAQAPLQQCDIDAIRTWILNGAAND